MDRIRECFRRAKAQGRGAFVAYFTIGYPSIQESEHAVETLIAEGADIIELGVPSSDPFADGEVIRNANLVAIRRGTSIGDVLAMAFRVRARHPDVGLVLFSYYDVLERAGLRNVVYAAKSSGIDTILAAGMPEDCRGQLAAAVEAGGMSYVPLIPPDMPISAVRNVVEGDGLDDTFLYAMTVKGRTGVRKTLPAGLSSRLGELRKAVKLPIVAGFGISNRKQGEVVANHADGYVIGSALVKRFSRSFSIKVCGVNNSVVAAESIRLGADYLGFIFEPSSPRAVSVESAREIAKEANGVGLVGVFVSQSVGEISAIMRRAGLNIVQLHRRALESEVAALRKKGFEVWTLAGGAVGDGVLFDSSHGNGEKTFRRGRYKSIIAGGISKANIGEAIRTGADVIDVNSSLETRPGHKDVKKLQAFFANIDKELPKLV